ncbi:MAG: type I secretion system permease/ATPase, partial [Methyloligellaceae bacterium]
FATLFVQILVLLTPFIFQVVIDKVLVHHGMKTLHVVILGLVLVALFQIILSALRTYVTTHTASKVDVTLGSKLFRHLMALPISYFESHQAGQSVARIRELENVRAFLTGSALTLCMDFMFIGIFLLVMWLYSWELTLIVMVSLPVYLLIWLTITPLLRHRIEEKFARSAENETFLVESITGVETLKSMALEPQMQRRWEDQLAGYTSASFAATKVSNIASHFALFVYATVIATVLWYGAQLVVEGSITAGQLIAFIMLTACVSTPILKLTDIWQDFQQLRVSVSRLGDILNMPPEADHETTRSTLKELEGSIFFENVTFRYGPGEPEILSNISIDVQAGEIIGIAGPSGSGKSTLVKLLQRLHVPESGRIMVDGVDIAMTNPRWLRRQIGIVLQENILFNRTVRENIALANPGMDFEEVIKAAKLAGAHDFIIKLPKGYDTVLVERGANLSGGQRQRVAIARALATDPKILIFDEATSALDYVSEYVIEQNMDDIAKGRTVFIVSHRLPAIRKASRIITIEQGRITEEGTHKELMRNNGRYAQLYKLQTYGDEGLEGW